MHLKRKSLLLALLMLSSLFFGMTGALAATSNTDWADGTITMEGYGAAPDNARSAGQARIMARRAAVVDAYRNLGEYVEGVRIDSETTVQNMVVSDDRIRSRVSAVIKGAKVVSEQANADGSYTVVVRIPTYGKSDSLASAVLPSWNTVESFPTTYPSVYPSTPSDDWQGSSAAPAPTYSNNKARGNYTGLIVDCRGLGLQSVMSPTIRNSKNEPIYGYKNLDYNKVVEKGMAGYSKDGYSNLGRAGSRPLTVKAVRLDGHNSNPVLSLEDANRVLIENQASGFLNDCAVVFIK